jgi:hypothetical protein
MTLKFCRFAVLIRKHDLNATQRDGSTKLYHIIIVSYIISLILILVNYYSEITPILVIDFQKCHLNVYSWLAMKQSNAPPQSISNIKHFVIRVQFWIILLTRRELTSLL